MKYRTWENKKMVEHEVKGGMIWTQMWTQNGTPIYEGDVVRIHNIISHFNKYMLVKWEKRTMSWNIGTYKARGVLFNVVGNLYKSPKLSRLL